MMRRRLPLSAAMCAAAATLMLAACKSIPDTYAPPVQRKPLEGPDDTALRSFVNMNDPEAEAYVVRDVSKTLESGTWRWTGPRPELRFSLSATANQKLRVDFAIAESTFRQTGPVTLTFTVNGNLLDKVRYVSHGEKRFEKPAPASWLRTDVHNYVSIEVDKPWVAPTERTRLGIILIRAGFVQ